MKLHVSQLFLKPLSIQEFPGSYSGGATVELTGQA